MPRNSRRMTEILGRGSTPGAVAKNEPLDTLLPLVDRQCNVGGGTGKGAQKTADPGGAKWE
jgi:hypothetical protein